MLGHAVEEVKSTRKTPYHNPGVHKSSGFHLQDELDDIIEEFDEDETGEIEFLDFIKLAARFVEPEEDYDELRKELREVFMLYDKDARGYLPLAQFRSILKEIDPELPEDELDEILLEIDADNSGTIDFDGKCQYVKHLKEILNLKNLQNSWTLWLDLIEHKKLTRNVQRERYYSYS